MKRGRQRGAKNAKTDPAPALKTWHKPSQQQSTELHRTGIRTSIPKNCQNPIYEERGWRAGRAGGWE